MSVNVCVSVCKLAWIKKTRDIKLINVMTLIFIIRHCLLFFEYHPSSSLVLYSILSVSTTDCVYLQTSTPAEASPVRTAALVAVCSMPSSAPASQISRGIYVKLVGYIIAYLQSNSLNKYSTLYKYWYKNVRI